MLSFWFDNWIENQNLVEILEVDEDNILHLDAQVCDFIQQNSGCDILKLQHVLNNHRIVHNIQVLIIPIHETNDSFCWGLSSSSYSTTKSGIWEL